MKRLLENIKHLPSTVSGVLVPAGLILADPRIAALATVDPHIAAVIGKATAVTAGLAMIFGMGHDVTGGK